MAVSEEDSMVGPVHDEAYTRRSVEAQFGSCRIGSVVVPAMLQANVGRAIDRFPNKSVVRNAALKLYDRFRETAAFDRSVRYQFRPVADAGPASEDRTVYDTTTASAYAAGAMPSAFAATLRVFEEAKRRWPADAPPPQRILDWGCGVGSAGWAASRVWPDSVQEYTGVDRSTSMLWLARDLLKGVEEPDLASVSERPPPWTINLTKDSISVARKESRAPPSDNPEFAPGLPDAGRPGDLAVMAFTLSDLPHRTARQESVLALWNSGAETMVVVDRGTPRGFQLVADARQQLLALGRRNDAKGTAEGSHVLAPCPHDGVCPLHKTANYCHFSQRVERPSWLRQTKHSDRADEDAKFSYVVIRRGSRPRVDSDAIASGVWPRVILPPSKAKGHVLLDVCSPEGAPRPRVSVRKADQPAMAANIQRLTVPKSAGKQAYYDARKAYWGDLWPHGSKKPGQVKTPKPLRLDDDRAYDEEKDAFRPNRRVGRGLSRMDRKGGLRRSLQDVDAMHA